MTVPHYYATSVTYQKIMFAFLSKSILITSFTLYFELPSIITYVCFTLSHSFKVGL